MAKGDICRFEDGYVVDVQSDLLSDLQTRVVVPLKPIAQYALPAERLNPVVRISGDNWVLLPQFIATVGLAEIGEKVGEFEDSFALTNALDMVFHGF
ncbi:CcdB family protein [Thalassospira tepidiphila]|uniref:Toxin CcdB n=2 Tax=Thalassospira tepidiphila TaxID=393657 RepID=A0A853KW73_9PROT|nr:CcdB family protein [Thalassospira tepidiphila]NJB76175.1 toxin CcdB [Thalassospira tepidiphila]OAZ08261.1 plasmid maintenance protein CcdB [Thalassospira tepidiphila MCCC 1A03514]